MRQQGVTHVRRWTIVSRLMLDLVVRGVQVECVWHGPCEAEGYGAHLILSIFGRVPSKYVFDDILFDDIFEPEFEGLDDD